MDVKIIRNLWSHADKYCIEYIRYAFKKSETVNSLKNCQVPSFYFCRESVKFKLKSRSGILLNFIDLGVINNA